MSSPPPATTAFPPARVARVLLFALPLLALTSSFGMALAQLLILAYALGPARTRLWQWYHTNWRACGGIIAAFAGFFVLSALRAVFAHKGLSALDGPLRMLLALSCIGFVACLKPRFGEFMLGLCLGVLGAFGIALLQRLLLGMERVEGFTHHPISFGDLALAMGVLALAALPGWREAPRWQRLLPVAALLAGLAVSVLSASRGGWLALPLLLLVPLLAGNLRLLRYTAVLLAACGLLFALAWVIPASGVAHRVGEAVSDVQQYAARQDATTSVGIRLELWKASWMMFQDHPWLGVGRDQFHDSLLALARQGRLQQSPALDYASSHNDALHFLATGGLLDFAFLLLLYGGPLLFFRRILRQYRSGSQHDAALAGMLLVLCFIGFGLTDVMFWLMIPKVFYVMFVGVLAGFCLQENA